MKYVVEKQQSPITLITGQVASLCLLVVAQCALANPTGGVVTSGDATIVNTGTTTTITQTSNKAIINWQDFSINSNELTHFVQPSTQSLTLNRVTGPNASQIMGNLRANGNIYIINPNGILFGQTARVDVGGLVASTSPITDSEFMNQSLQRFTQSLPGVSIINQGEISIRNAGIAVLVAPTVINQGIIQADLGVISIASANHFTLDLYGDDLIHFDAGSVLSQNGLVENVGVIQANGGKILISAQAADDMLENIVNLNGLVQADSVSQEKGKVILKGYDNSMLNIIGTVNISGDLGGLMNVEAENINMLAGSTINADTLFNGQGGRVIFWADNNTVAQGTITARGGAISGDGGFVETSAKNSVYVGGITVDASARNGLAGSWLIDPLIANIDNATADSIAATLEGGSNFSVWANDNISFDNDNLHNIDWTGSAVFNVRSDFNRDGVGTIVFTSTGTINAPLGTVNFYYNPTVFATPDAFPAVTAGTFNPYMLVNNATQLQAMNTNLSGYYALNNNIDVNDTIADFTSIGGEGGAAFTGHFTGSVPGALGDDQFVISDLVISAAGLNDVGLFGEIDSATLNDITLSNISVTGLGRVGGIVGYATNNSNLTGDFFVNSGTVVVHSSTGGGIVGRMDDITTSANFTNYANVSEFATAPTLGGILGFSSNTTLSGTLTNYGDVTGLFALGGVLGSGLDTTLSGSFINHGDILETSVTTGQAGGIAGALGGTISGTFTNRGNVQSYVNAGGIFGEILADTTFTDTAVLSTIADGTTLDIISLTGQAGGIIGNLTDNGLSFEPASLSTLVLNGGVVNVEGPRAGGIIGYFPTFVGAPYVSDPGDMTSMATVVGDFFAGGIFGILESPSFSTTASLINRGSVSSQSFAVGGIVGAMYGGNFLGPIVLGDLSGNSYQITTTTGTILGGVAGLFFNQATQASINLDDIIFHTNVSFINPGTLNYMGGVIGFANGDTTPTLLDITGTFSTNPLTLNANIAAGAIIGYLLDFTNFQNTFTNATQLTSNSTYVGGAVGLIENSVIGGSLANTGTISGVGNVGGVVGSFLNSSLTGELTGSGQVSGTGDDVGGLIGEWVGGTLDTTADLSTTSGSVSGASNVGGLIGNLSLDTYSAVNTFSNAADVTATTSKAGGIYGFTSAAITTYNNNLTNSGDVTSSGTAFGDGAGGIMPHAQFLTAFTGNLTNTGSISGINYVGGLFGFAEDVQIFGQLQTSVGSITATGDSAGGLIGYALGNGLFDTNATLNNLGSSVSGDDYVGGIIGRLGGSHTWNMTAEITNSGDITGTGLYAGGLFGYNEGNTTVVPLSNSGSVTGNSHVGGIAGYLNASSIQNAQMVSGTVSGNFRVGGIAGFSNSSTISDALFGGTLEATGIAPSQFGGIVGNNSGTINNTLAVGTMNTDLATQVGAVVGTNFDTITNSYFDTRLFSTGVGTGADTTIGYGTNAAFTSQASYAGFAFPGTWFLSGTDYYASLTFCGGACRILLPVTPTPPNPTPVSGISQIIQTQIVNNENNFKQEPILNNNVILVVEYLGELLDQMNFSDDPAGQSAEWFFVNSIILQIGDMVEQTGNDDPIVIMQETVQALQSAYSCPAP